MSDNSVYKMYVQCHSVMFGVWQTFVEAGLVSRRIGTYRGALVSSKFDNSDTESQEDE